MNTQMPPVKLSWSAAEVKDARLTVALEGVVPKGWKQSFERTVKLLGDGDWGPVELKRKTVQVSDVAPGTEDKLRHHLEAIVAQANAAHEDDGDEEREEREGPDAEMTDRFRAFAEDDDEAEEGD
jgi:hypothetical protein